MGLFDNLFGNGQSKVNKETEDKKYAVIINKKQTLSTINGNRTFNWKNETIMKLAGISAWKEHNFYPEDGMAGEIVDSFYNSLNHYQVYILFIDNKFYVPMSEKGIKFINKQEMLKIQQGSSKNYDLPESILSFHKETERNLQRLRDAEKHGVFIPKLNDCRSGFAEDIVQNYRHIALNFKYGTGEDVMIMVENYAIEMALEYKRQNMNILPPSIIADIIEQINDVLKQVLPSFATQEFLQKLQVRIHRKLERADIQKYIEDY